MTLTLELSADLQSRLTHEAAVLGVPVEKYALEVLEQRHPHSSPSNSLAADLQARIEASLGQPPSETVISSPGVPKGPSAEQVLGLWSVGEIAPTDEECEQMLSEELQRKHAS